MLHKPDVNTARILELADFIENLPCEKFAMTTFGQWEEPRCICGWLLHNTAHIYKDDTDLAGEMLGLNQHMARMLFGGNIPYSNKQAASVLRHLAVTGELP